MPVGTGLKSGWTLLQSGYPEHPEELPEAAEPDLHRPPALVAGAVGDLGLHGLDGPVLVALEVGGVATVRVAAAGEELAAPPPFDDHRLAALLARQVGRALLALHVAHLDLGPLEVLRERLPEAPHRRDPVLAALLDQVELVLHAGRELDVEDVGERVDQQVGDQHRRARWAAAACCSSSTTYSLLRMVPMMLAYVDGRPMPFSSSSLISVACVKRGGGWVKCCSGTQLAQRHHLAFDERRELALGVLVVGRVRSSRPSV